MGSSRKSVDDNHFEIINDIDISELKALKDKNLKNPFLCFLNINSLRHKIIDLRHILIHTGLEIVIIGELNSIQSSLMTNFILTGIHSLLIGVTEINTVVVINVYQK